MTEIWKDIEGYRGLYQVSNLGRVKSLDRIVMYSNGILKAHKGVVLTSKNHDFGYSFVLLSRNGVRVNNYIHRLVAKAFIPNPEGKPEVNHINGLKKDNRVSNLEWCTRGENCIHSYKNGLSKRQVGVDASQSKLNDDKVLSIRNMYATGDYSQSKIAYIFNLDQSTVSYIVNRKTWSHL